MEPIKSRENLAVVTIVGRPNVGKSSLFNRLLGSEKAIVHDQPGVTRDGHYELSTLGGREGDRDYILVDTGGLYADQKEQKRPDVHELRLQHGLQVQEYLQYLIGQQGERVLADSNLVLFVVDIREGLIPSDEILIRKIRETGKDFWLVINKCDQESMERDKYVFFRLGVKEEQIYPVSAAHSYGIEDLERALYSYLGAHGLGRTVLAQNEELLKSTVAPIGRLAIIGSPNTGKSTLLNSLLKEERSLVSEVPGTTMDPVEGHFDLYFTPKELAHFEQTQLNRETQVHERTVEQEEGVRWRSIEVVDTAGIRRKTRVEEGLEEMAVVRALRSVYASDVVLLMVDAQVGVGHHDKKLVDIALEKGKSVIVVVNKIDLFKELKQKAFFDEWVGAIRDSLPWKFISVVPVSAKQKTHMGNLKEMIKRSLIARRKKIPTAALNRCIADLLTQKQVSMKTLGRGKPFKVRYSSVVKVNPLVIVLHANLSRDIPDHYQRYLINGIRAHFGLINMPIQLIFRSSHKNEEKSAT